jgi:hypothetical protein
MCVVFWCAQLWLGTPGHEELLLTLAQWVPAWGFQDRPCCSLAKGVIIPLAGAGVGAGGRLVSAGFMAWKSEGVWAEASQQCLLLALRLLLSCTHDNGTPAGASAGLPRPACYEPAGNVAISQRRFVLHLAGTPGPKASARFCSPKTKVLYDPSPAKRPLSCVFW